MRIHQKMIYSKHLSYMIKNYYILRIILKHVRKILKENQNSYVGFLILEPLYVCMYLFFHH